MIKHLIRHLGANHKICKTFGAIFMAVILVGAFSAINANESKSYNTLTIAAKADKKSTTAGGGGDTNTLIKSPTLLIEKWHTTKEQKTGGFIGAELGLGIINASAITSPPKAQLTAYVNAFGGYQFYFFDKPYFHLGFRFRAHLGYGNYNESASGVDLYSDAIQYGTEAQFLWDFVNKGKHTIGVHLSTGGIEGGTTFKSMSAAYGASVKMETQTDFVYILSSGIHIYLNVNHQFFMTYKYRVPLFTIHHNTRVIDYANGHSHASRQGLESMTHSFTASYSYKF